MAGLRQAGALFPARVIEVAAPLVGDVDVGLLDVADHLVVELLLQALGWLHDGGSVSVLGFQVLRHFGILLVAQPAVIVHQIAAVDVVLRVNFFSDWRRDWRRRGVGAACRLVICVEKSGHEEKENN